MCNFNEANTENEIIRRPEYLGFAYGLNTGLANMHPFTHTFDRMQHKPLSDYLRKEEIYMLYCLGVSPKYANSNMGVRFKVYDKILNPFGFVRSFSGTNRVVYSHTTDKTFLLKIALDRVGVSDNRGEYKNQEFIKPFVPKVFDISDCGTVQMIEKVKPIMNQKEFADHAEDVFGVIQYLTSHGFILEDIGTDFFMNWGIRPGFGAVLLDFPYIYRSNIERMRCIHNIPGKGRCNGKLDYEEGYNFIHCTKCGRRYAAKDIGSEIGVFKQKRRRKNMIKRINVTVIKDGKKYVNGNVSSAPFIPKEEIVSNVIKKQNVPEYGNTFHRGESYSNNRSNSNNGQRTAMIYTSSELQSKIEEIERKFNVSVNKMMEDEEVVSFVSQYMVVNRSDYMTRFMICDIGNKMSREEIDKAFSTNNYRHPQYVAINGRNMSTYVSTADPFIKKDKYADCFYDALYDYINTVDPDKYLHPDVAHEESSNEETATVYIPNTPADIKLEEKEVTEAEVVTSSIESGIKLDNENSIGSSVITTDDAIDTVAVPVKGGTILNNEF